jgi:hypothetical protein
MEKEDYQQDEECENGIVYVFGRRSSAPPRGGGLGADRDQHPHFTTLFQHTDRQGGIGVDDSDYCTNKVAGARCPVLLPVRV